MAWTYDNSARVAALNAICALLNGGKAFLLTSGDDELAAPTFGSPAFGSGTSAAPSVATANALTADSSVTAGTIGKIVFKTSGGTAIKSGTVAVGSGDFQVADNVIPAGATSVNLTSLTFSLTLGGS